MLRRRKRRKLRENGKFLGIWRRKNFYLKKIPRISRLFLSKKKYREFSHFRRLNIPPPPQVPKQMAYLSTTSFRFYLNVSDFKNVVHILYFRCFKLERGRARSRFSGESCPSSSTIHLHQLPFNAVKVC